MTGGDLSARIAHLVRTHFRTLIALVLAAFALAFVLAMTGCAYPTRNVEIAKISPFKGYRWNTLDKGKMPETLVIVTASGGGTRAAVLEESVLEGMNDIAMKDGKSLADRIDVLSSVSGGSVTAAYFTAHGTKGFPKLTKFLRQDGIADIVWHGLNPVVLFKLATPSLERIDLQINYFNHGLFHGETFQSLIDRNRRPFLVMNASDMVEGVPFSFTQQNFDLLCSDLSKMKLATAVATSAAVPVLVSPLTLNDYSNCAAERKLPGWPPHWVTTGFGTDWYNNPARVSRGRVLDAYAEGNKRAHPKDYVHLLDGGISDNLGVSAPLRFLTTASSSPSFLNAIAQGKIKRLIFIMINAATAPQSGLDEQKATPGILSMLGASVDAGISRTTMGSSERVRQVLLNAFAAQARYWKAQGEDALANNLAKFARHTHLITVDFDAIKNPGCRLAYHSIATSWTLPKRQINGLLVVGKALLASDPGFVPAVHDVGGTLTRPLPTVTAACKVIGH